MDNIELKPLSNSPRAEMGPKAVEKMMQWGLEAQQIKELREITGEYDYDSVVQRLDRLARQDVFVATDDEGTKQVVIPNFYTPNEGNQGNCTELSFKLATGEKFKNWVSVANGILQGKDKPSLEVCICGGQADEFFITPPKDDMPGDFHQWVGVRLTGEPFVEDMINIDPALGSVHSTSERQYNHMEVYYPLEGEIVHPITEKLEVGKIGKDQRGELDISADADIHVTLGLSANGRFSYNIAFLEREDTSQLVPLLTAVNKDKSEYNMFFIDPFENSSKGGGDSELSPDEIAEIKAILDITGKFRINTDIAQFPYPIDTKYLEDKEQYLAISQLPS